MLLPAVSRIGARTGGEVIRYRRRLYVACSHCRDFVCVFCGEELPQEWNVGEPG